MILTQKHLSRRGLLRGVGATVALPMLDAMFPALSSAAKTAKRVAPNRMVYVYVPNGIDMRNWRLSSNSVRTRRSRNWDRASRK